MVQILLDLVGLVVLGFVRWVGFHQIPLYLASQDAYGCFTEKWTLVGPPSLEPTA